MKANSDRRRPSQGDFLYFQVASVVACQCVAVQGELSRMSWPRIRKGYAALVHLYGDSNVAENRFAIMAYEAYDRPSALGTFMEIGDKWDPGAWTAKAYFDQANYWARE